MVYCSFVLNVWMYVRLRSYRERSDWRARGTRRRSPWVAAGWWRQVSLDPSLSYTFLIHLPHFTFIPKDWLAFVIHVLVYLFGLDYYCLALCYCSTLINEHDEIYQWYVVSLLYYDVILVSFKGARVVSRVPLRKDLFIGWPPGKTVQPWGWNGMPLAE
jgi:hypothetical protein